jgi:hypothetical protein
MPECILEVSGLSVFSSVQSIKQVPKHTLLSSESLSLTDVNAHARVLGSFSRSSIATHEITACNTNAYMRQIHAACAFFPVFALLRDFPLPSGVWRASSRASLSIVCFR